MTQFLLGISLWLLIAMHEVAGTDSSSAKYQELATQYKTSRKYQHNLKGNYMTLYYADINFGIPAQPQSLIIDTGSVATMFPCSGCANCGKHTHPYYQLDLTQTIKKTKCDDPIAGQFKCQCKNNMCNFEELFAGNSKVTGFLVNDFVELDNDPKTPPVRAMFGCVTSEGDRLKKQELDGILGLGRYTNTTDRVPNFIDYASKEAGKQLSFSLCLAMERGLLGIGGFNTQTHYSDSQVQVIPMVKNARSKMYAVNVKRVKLNGKWVQLEASDFDAGEGTFLDSGTPFLSAHPKVYRTIRDSLAHVCKAIKCGGTGEIKRTPRTICYPSAMEDFNAFYESFPTFTFYMENNATWDWTPENYLYMDEYEEAFCLGIMEMPGRVILGTNFMMNHDVLFDREHDLIAFTKANCTFGLPKIDPSPIDPTPIDPIPIDPISTQHETNPVDSIVYTTEL